MLFEMEQTFLNYNNFVYIDMYKFLVFQDVYVVNCAENKYS